MTGEYSIPVSYIANIAPWGMQLCTLVIDIAI